MELPERKGIKIGFKNLKTGRIFIPLHSYGVEHYLVVYSSAANISEKTILRATEKPFSYLAFYFVVCKFIVISYYRIFCLHTLCPRSHDSFHIVSYHIKLVEASCLYCNAGMRIRFRPKKNRIRGSVPQTKGDI